MGKQQEKNSPVAGQASQFGTIFYVTIGISVAFVLAGVIFTGIFSDVLQTIVNAILNYLGWAYLLVVSFFLVFAIFLAISRFGKIRLGGDDERPEFGRFPWFAMLFQAGMGIGLLFWAVSEPLLHYANPPFNLAEPRSAEAASLSIQYSYFHWTLHPWAIYSIVGIAVGYFSYRRGARSLRISSVLRPLIGDRVDGPLGKAVDVVAIIATLFGVAVSLGLGTLQIAAGLGEAFGTPSGQTVVLLIIVVTAVAYMLSAATPIEKGVNLLSQLSIYLAALLLVYVFVLGPTMMQLNTFTQEVGGYLFNLIPMSLRLDAFQPGGDWLLNWTVFFWATWISWAPFVGAFIARISRGRTIREFVLGVLVAPSLGSMLWFAVFGASAIKLDNQLGGALTSAAEQSAAVALFTFLGHYPISLVASALTIFLVWIFFVAGADAGTIVLGGMSAGVLDPPRASKLTWGVVMGALAAILLVAGGLDALQQGAILAATPFMIVMLALCWALSKALIEDSRAGRPEVQSGGTEPALARAKPASNPEAASGPTSRSNE